MKRRIALQVSLALILPFPIGLITECCGQDARAAAKGDKSLEASRCVSVWSKKPSDEGNQPGRVVRYGLTYQDFDRLVSTVPTIKRARPIRAIPRQIRHLDKSVDGYVIGTTREYAAFARLEIDRGRFLTENDNAKYENYAVLGAARRRFSSLSKIRLAKRSNSALTITRSWAWPSRARARTASAISVPWWLLTWTHIFLSIRAGFGLVRGW